jgi:hypothetical protein
MKSESISEVLSAIQGTIYSDVGGLAEIKAVEKLEQLADQKVPEAIHQLGQLLWEGVAVHADEEKAFRYISEAVALGHSPAMTSLGAMCMVGAGCDKNFAAALNLYHRRRETWDGMPSIRIGRVGLNDNEFRSEFSLEMNGRRLVAPDSVLEKFNHWRLESKAKFIDKQSATLEKNPNALGGVSKRQLPFKGYIGGSCLRITGSKQIEKIGFREELIGSEFWISWSEFSGAGVPISLGDLTSLNSLPLDEVEGIRNAYATHVKSKRHRSIIAKFLARLNLPSIRPEPQYEFELQLIGSSVHRETKLLCAGNEVFSKYED